MYGLPARLLITWRGHLGKDAPEHILTGEISPGLLDLLRIPHRVLSADTLEADLAWTVETMDRAMQPVALLVPPGVVEIGQAGHGADPTRPSAARDCACGSAASRHLRSSRLRSQETGRVAAVRKALDAARDP
jgi:hypothetical protein